MTKRHFRLPLAVFLLSGALTACAGGGGVAPPAGPLSAPNSAGQSAAMQQSATQQSTTTQSVSLESEAAAGTAPTSFKWSHIYKTVPRPSAAAPRQSVTVESPFNLAYFGGVFVQHLVSHDVNVNCPASCWGTAGRGTANNALVNLGHSNFIHIVDQYVASTANNRYTVAPDLNFKVTLPHIVNVPQIIALAHAAAVAAHGSGYGHEYHLFLPKGTDTCLSATVCYSPDNPSTFVFCAYHASVDFTDVGHVLLSVEPYQFINACVFPGTTPHGAIDVTTSTLSHELMETITDPDGTAWFNYLFGLEIGDECRSFFSDDNLNGMFYDIQFEYSNAANGCVNGV